MQYSWKHLCLAREYESNIFATLSRATILVLYTVWVLKNRSRIEINQSCFTSPLLNVVVPMESHERFYSDSRAP